MSVTEPTRRYGTPRWLPAALFAVIASLPGSWGVLSDALAQETQPPEQPVAEDAAERAAEEAEEAEEAARTPVEQLPGEQLPGEPDEAAAEEPAEAPDEASAGADSTAPSAISGSRDLLRLFGIDESRFKLLLDRSPWQESEDDVLLRILYRIHRDFRLMDIERWSRGAPEPAELAKDPGTHRGEIFQLAGRVKGVEVCRPEQKKREQFELEQYYRCRFQLGPKQQPAVVFAREIPKAWKTGEPIDERAGAFGLFLKLGSEDPDEPQPIFAARRVAWYPPTLLGNLGMDEGLFDDVRPESVPGDPESQDGSPDGSPEQIKLRDLRLTSRDRECFYQLLAAVGRTEPGQLIGEANQELKRIGKKRFSVVPLFNKPRQQQGRLFVLTGTTRRIQRIRVSSQSDEDVIARFGITPYYQVFLFTEDSQSNPLVFCVRELPPGLSPGDGSQYAESVTVAGIYFKKWAYRVQLPDETSRVEEQWQLAPLLIGRDLVWHPREKPAANPWIGAIAGGLFVLALLGVWLALWRYSRGDRQFREKTIARQFAMDSGVSLDQLDLHADGTPDFSGLEQADHSDSEDSGRP